MGREEEEMREARRGYREAEREGNHEEEARWANVVGDLYKQRGEYVEALKWLRIDYDVSSRYLPQKQLLPTCQSLGELHLRLQHYEDALLYQKKHLDLAKDSNDLIEQQRASTQLGRTYHEIFLKSENDHTAIRNSKKYFKSAMKLARQLKEEPPCSISSFFLKECIDAHNNIGMLEMDLDNLEEAENILVQGLKICNDEEVTENDDARSRLHHNLGSVYIELRDWGKAKIHIEKDILICKSIDHPQGEAKGFINLGELHYRVQKYDEAIRCYQKALDIAKCMEDESALVDQIKENIRTVKEAARVLEESKKDEQKLKKLVRTTYDARGTSNERKFLLEQCVLLDCLIEKSSMIFSWQRHREFAKRKKRVANELCDKEKLSDSFLAIAESYQKLRKFPKARKWYMKSWNIYRSIGNLEGQALAKINVGEVLDSSGDWAGALQAFEEGYRLAVEGNLMMVKLSALENMHYSHMIRFDNIDEARKIQQDIHMLRKSLNDVDEVRNLGNDYCSETETEGTDLSERFSDSAGSPTTDRHAKSPANTLADIEELDDDIPLVSLVRQNKKKHTSKHKTPEIDTCQGLATNSGRKRAHLVISDDEADEHYRMDQSREGARRDFSNGVATLDRDRRLQEAIGTNEVLEVSQTGASKDVVSVCTPIDIGGSSFRAKSPKLTTGSVMDSGSSDAELANPFKPRASGSRVNSGCDSGNLQQSQCGAGFKLPEGHGGYTVVFKIDKDFIDVDVSSCFDGDHINIESMKIEVACMYYLQLSEENRCKGLFPVIGLLSYCGKPLSSTGQIEDFKRFFHEKLCIEVMIDGWIPKRLLKMYIDYCVELSEVPNRRLLGKLYNLQVSEDEVVVSDCGLQDLSVSPFLNALQVHKTIAVLDISHNLLGNATMEKLQQIFTSSSQKYGGLTLDLHCNRFGPTALFQICECSVMLNRLEVLNLSENRLTDACSSYLATILEKCKALYSLNIEQCSITSRAVQKVADSLHDESVLSQLSLGKNNPISASALANLLSKLASLKHFSELSLVGVKLNKPMVDSLCKLVKTSGLSALLVGGTYIGSDGAVRLTEALAGGLQELVKLDLSYCGLTSSEFPKVCADIASIGSILELNLGGNSIGQEGSDALACVLMDPQCSLRSLILDKCHLGLRGIIRIVQALSGNESLEELRLAENSDVSEEGTIQFDSSTTPSRAKPGAETFILNAECDTMAVADSDDENNNDPSPSGPAGSCASSCEKSPFTGSQIIQDLSSAIALATHLQLLDLSKTGFSPEASDELYTSWSSPASRHAGIARKHVNKHHQILHFSVEGKPCCGIRSCCRRD